MGSGNQRCMHRDGRYTIGGVTVTKIVGGQYYDGHLVPGTGSTEQVSHPESSSKKKKIDANEKKAEKQANIYRFQLLREGKKRKWIDASGRQRTEEVLTAVSVLRRGRKKKDLVLPRGICVSFARKFLGINLKIGRQVFVQLIVSGQINIIGEDKANEVVK